MRQLVATFFLIAAMLSLHASGPDFAYPAKVSANALASYSSAIKQGDELTALRQMMDYYLAQTSKGEENQVKALSWVSEKLADYNNPIFRSLGQTFYAKALTEYFRGNRWTFDSRELPLYPLPESVDRWSGAQFRMVVDSIYAKAFSTAGILREAPVQGYPLIIKCDRADIPYFPSLLDFVVNISAERPESETPEIDESLLRRMVSLKPVPTTGIPVLDCYSLVIEGKDSLSSPVVWWSFNRLKKAVELSNTDGADLFMDFYRLLSNDDGTPKCEAAALVLALSPMAYQDPEKFYDLSRSYVTAYPSGRFSAPLRSSILRYEQPEVNVLIPGYAMPGHDFSLNVTAKNLRNCKVDFYRADALASVNPWRDDIRKYVKGKPFASFDIDLPEAQVGKEVKVSRPVSLSDAGIYVATVSFKGMDPSQKPSVTTVNVSDLLLVALGTGDYNLISVNAMTGIGVGQADIFYQRDWRSAAVKIGMTDAKGVYKLTGQNEKINGTYYTRKGQDIFSPGIDVNRPWRNENEFSVVKIFTSLPLYHLGDTIEWAGVAYKVYKDGISLPEKGKELTFKLMSPSWDVIDTLKLTSDDFGRVKGRFVTKKTLLTGRYSIALDNNESIVSFEVSDYKLPSFEVIIDQPRWGTDSLVVSGKVTTYTGFPVREAAVSIDLDTRAVWWRHFGGSTKVDISLSCSTDAEGRFSAAVPVSQLLPEDSPVVYVARVSALSATGETQQNSKWFARSSVYRIEANIPENICLDKGEWSATVTVKNSLDSVVKVPLDFALIKDGEVRLEGNLRSSHISASDFSGCKSGAYDLKIFASDPTLKTDTLTSRVVLFRTTDQVSPCPDRFVWCPDTSIGLKAGEKGCNVLYAVNRTCTLRAYLVNDTQTIWHEEKQLEAGVSRCVFNVPEDIEEAFLHLIFIGGGEIGSLEIPIRREQPRNMLKFSVESFRDHLIPGSSEKWVFKVVDGSDDGRMAAVIAGMYNSALESLAHADWNFNVIRRSDSNRWSLFRYYARRNSVNAFASSDEINRLAREFKNLQPPSFELYGLSLGRGLRIRGYGAMRSMNTMAGSVKKMAMTDAVAEEFEEEGVVEAATMNSAVAVAFDADAGSSGAEVPQPVVDNFEYRDSETPLAFFRPVLETDSLGRLSLTFTVPDANARWAFRAIAFTDSLLTASFASDVIASKPLMVKPNLPRFVRAGDRVEVPVEIRNTTDTVLSVSTRVELFSPDTGEVLLSKAYSDTIPAGQSAVVSTMLDIPDGVSTVGYRVKSSSADFADGEQSILVVLPSMTTVYGSYPFYIHPDSTTFSTVLPTIPQSSKVTLQYCNNPAWYLVTALPGLVSGEPSTSPEAAYRIFSAAVAQGILKRNPEISTALDEWRKAPETEVLESMLERNTDLKQLLLESTPWLSNAKNDSERMSRLSILLSPQAIQSSISSAIKALERLEGKNGGWKWCEGYEVTSSWATSRVLSTMGLLNMLGFLPEDGNLRSMIKNALAYEDDLVRKEFAKYPKTTYPHYVLTHQLLADVYAGPNATAAVNYTIQSLVKDWRKLSLAEKSDAALILNRGGHPRVARQILASIGEFAESSPSRGVYFPSLEHNWYGVRGKIGITAGILLTYRELSPESKEIPGICQWLITEKSTTDWGSSADASMAIASVLLSSPDLLARNAEPEIKIGEYEVDFSSRDNFTGEFTRNVPASVASGASLTIRNHDKVPSWGAVMWQYQDSMASVKATGCDGLSISKSFVVIGADGTVTERTAFAVGDRVRVTLRLSVGQDLDYVTIVDDRPASFEPVEQLPGPIYSEGIWFYRENRDASTRLFIDRLPKGEYVLSYEMWVNNAGEFASGVATVQSQYAPRFVAGSAGNEIKVVAKSSPEYL